MKRGVFHFGVVAEVNAQVLQNAGGLEFGNALRDVSYILVDELAPAQIPER